jgi:hypothetical protein
MEAEPGQRLDELVLLGQPIDHRLQAWACREIASAVELVGHEVVEVLPDRIGSRDITALVAERVVRETLTGLALAHVREQART